MKVLLLAVLAFAAVTAEESQVLKNFAVGQTQFTANVYKEFGKSNSGNFVICPLSADIVLALLHEAAQGKTAHQISQALHLPEDKTEIQKIIREVIPHLKGNDKYSLSSANKIYLKHGFEIAEQFKNTAVDVYGAEVENIDFAKAEQAAKQINQWVEGKTANKIKDLIKTNDLDENVRTILVNALYFQGKWKNPFNAKSSAKKPFYVNKNKQIEVNMMHKTATYKYYESAELKAKYLELPYQGDEVTMTIVLPDDVEGLSALEGKLADVLVAPEYTREHLRVALPKFTTETTIEIKPILEALGVADAFQDSADFGAMTVNHDHLKVSKVVQKTFIDVNEEGTTAAAATAVLVNLGGSARPPKEFKVDHPFIYYLSSPAGILFVGRYIH